MPVPTVLESIIANQFLKIPSWARIITYFVCLIVIVYQVIFPKFIDGEVRDYKGEDFKGSFSPNRDTKVGTKYHGRFIATVTSAKGDWSLPLLDSAITGDIDLRIEFLSPKGETLYESVIVPRTIALMDNVLIGYNANTTQKFKLLNVVDTETVSPDDRAGMPIGFNFITSAYAQEEYQQQYAPVESEINKVVKKLRPSVTTSDDLFYSEKKAIQSDIETKYNIQLDTVDIQQSKSVKDLSKIAVTKIIAKGGVNNYAYYGNFNTSGNWSERYFKIIGSESKRAPQSGDIVVATGTVNIRAGYIEYRWLSGWENKPAIGVINPGDKLLIEEVKRVAGDFVWVKFHLVE